jgi:hypothetical protein
MKIAILNFEQPWHVLASTSLIRGLRNAHPSASISFFVAEESFPLIQFNKNVEAVSGYICPTDKSYDLAINMSPSVEACSFMTELRSSDKRGFFEKIGAVSAINNDADEYFSIMHNGDKSERHALQVIFRLCGMTWKGEGYDLAYFPKNKTHKRKTGIAISHDPLRTFIKNNLKLQMTEIWHVPMKKNLFKRMDEINRCMYILTDDLFTLHASIALRKNVEFLDVIGLNTRLEFFGRGNYYRISDGDWRVQMEKDRVEESIQSPQEAFDL